MSKGRLSLSSVRNRSPHTGVHGMAEMACKLLSEGRNRPTFTRVWEFRHYPAWG